MPVEQVLDVGEHLHVLSDLIRGAQARNRIARKLRILVVLIAAIEGGADVAPCAAHRPVRQHPDVCAQFAQKVEEVVGEAVIIIDQKKHFGRNVLNFRRNSAVPMVEAVI